MKVRGLSPKTITAYCSCVRYFLGFLQTDYAVLDVEKIKAFLLHRQSLGAAPQTVNLYLNAIKFFYREVLKNPAIIPLKFAKRNRRLPVLLSKEEVLSVLANLRNRKHRLLVALAYGAGLRVSEVVALKAGDIDFENMLVYVRKGKGGKDRVTLLPQKLKDELRAFIFGKAITDYIFESQRGGKLHSRTAQKVFGAALRKAGIAKTASFHSLRHSFATHLIENGVGIRYVQELLGHSNIRTTQIYTRVTSVALARIQSPLE